MTTNRALKKFERIKVSDSGKGGVMDAVTNINRNALKKHIVENIDLLMRTAEIEVDTIRTEAFGGDIHLLHFISVELKNIPLSAGKDQHEN